MAKLILVVLGLLLVYWIIRGYRRRVESERTEPPPHSEDMVRCAHCGVHLPRGDSVALRDTYYCSPEHERLHQRPN